ncbi:hypothetical protein C8R46DRAFT_421438 [Mycena filopes]|nr:hypothetical protein C8R46DRAFT_421438 [Mycena filopes]
MPALLPLELQRKIFEIAIRLNHEDAKIKLNLNLVAHRVHFWVDRTFYRAVSISDSKNAAKFLNLIDSKSARFFASRVKVLILVSSVTNRQASRILNACRGVESLAFTSRYYCFRPLVAQLPLRRLSLGFRDLANSINSGRPLICLSTLTHLDLVFDEFPVASDLPATLQKLSALTHVAVASRFSPADHARSVIEGCPALQVLVILVEDFDIPDEEIDEIYSFDHRIVATPDSIATDWVAPYLGFDDPWTSAEGVVAGRRARRKAEQMWTSKLEYLSIEYFSEW